MAKNRIVKDNKSGKFLVLNTETNSPVKLSATERIVKDNVTGKYLVINTETKEKISLDSLSSLKKKDVTESSGKTPSTDGKSDTSKLQAQVDFFGKDSAIFKKQEPITDKPASPKLKTEELTVDKQKAEKFIAKKEEEDIISLLENEKRKQVEKAYDLATEKEENWTLTNALKSGEYKVYQGGAALLGGLMQYINKITGGAPEFEKASDNLYEMSLALSEQSESFLRTAQRDAGIKDDNISKGIVELLGNGEISQGMTKLGVEALATIPQMIAIAGSGGTTTSTFLAGTAMSTGLNLSEEYAGDKDVSAADAISSGIKGVISGAIETIFNADVVAIRSLAGDKAAKETLGGLINSPITQAFRDFIGNVGEKKAKDEIERSYMKAFLKGFASGGAQEGFEEVAESISGFIVDTIKEGKFDNEKYEQMLSNLPDQFLIGFASGGPVSGVAMLSSVKKLTSDQKEKIKNYKKILNTDGISSLTKTVVEKKINEIRKYNKEEAVEDYMKLDKLSLNDRKSALEILSKINKLQDDKGKIKDTEAIDAINKEIDEAYNEFDNIVTKNEPQPIQARDSKSEEKIPQSEQPVERPSEPIVEETIQKEAEVKPKKELTPEQKTKQEIKDPFGTVENGPATREGVYRKIRDEIKKTNDTKAAVENGIQELQGTDAYKQASDIAKEAMVRNVRKEFKQRQKAAPNVTKLLDSPIGRKETIEETKKLKESEEYQKASKKEQKRMLDNLNTALKERFSDKKAVEKVLVDTMDALKDQLRLESNAAKEGIGAVRETISEVVGYINKAFQTGKLTYRQQKSLINILNKDLLKQNIRDKEIEKAKKIIQDSQYAAKVNYASDLRKSIGKILKDPKLPANVKNAARNFFKINPTNQEDVDTYISYAKSIIRSRQKDTVKKGVVQSTRKPFSINEVNDYAKLKEKERVEKEIERETARLTEAYNIAKEQGIIGADVSFETFVNNINEAISGTEDSNVDNQVLLREYYQDKFDELYEDFFDVIGDEADSYTKDIISEAVSQIRFNFDSMSISEQRQALDIMENYIQNGIIDEAGVVSSTLKGKENARYFSKNKVFDYVVGLVGRIPKVGDLYGSIWSKYISPLSSFLTNRFRSAKVAREFMADSGLTGIISGHVTAKKESDRISKGYNDNFGNTNPNGKSFNSAYNEYERGMFASLQRTIKDGTPEEIQKEFDRQKGHIEKTIELLKKSGRNRFKKIGEILEEVYNDKIKDANNIDEVKKSVSKENQDAVNYIVNEWTRLFPDFKKKASAYHNILLDEDSNYSPDFYMKLVDKVSDDLLDGGIKNYSLFFDFIKEEEVGTFKKNKRITKNQFPKDKQTGAVTRVRDYSFSNNSFKAIEKAINDITTAQYVRQYNAFINSNDFNGMFEDDLKLAEFKEKVNYHVRLLTGSEMSGSKDSYTIKTAAKFISAFGRFGTRLGLGSVSNSLKQTVPIFFNTAINLGADPNESYKLLTSSLQDLSDVDAIKWMNNLDYTIALRGAEAQTSIEFAENLNKELNELEFGDPKSFGNRLNQIAEGMAKRGDAMIQQFLVKPDVAIARASWLAFYKKSLSEKGVDVSDIDWTTHKVDKESADYAEKIMQEQQNVNIPELAGKLFSSRTAPLKIVRQTLFTFASFSMNLKDRNATAIALMTSRNATEQEKRDAARVLFTGVVEAALFEMLSIGISSLVKSAAYSALGLIGESDDELQKAEQESNLEFRKKLFLGKVVSETLIPVPGFGEAELFSRINNIINYFSGGGTPEERYRDEQRIIKENITKENKLRAAVSRTRKRKKKIFAKAPSSKSAKQSYLDYLDQLKEQDFNFYVPKETDLAQIVGGSPGVGLEKVSQTESIIEDLARGYHIKNNKKYYYDNGEKALLAIAATASSLNLVSAKFAPKELSDIAKEIKRIVDKKSEFRTRDSNKNPKVSYNPNSVKGVRASSDNRPVSSWAELIAIPDMADPNGYRALENDPYAKKVFSLIKYTEEPFKQFYKFGAKDFAELDIEKVKNKIINYIGSDKSKERAKYFKEYTDRRFLKEDVISHLDKIPSQEKLRERIKNLKTVNVDIEKKGGRTGDAYYYDTHSITLEKNVSETTFAHELGHAMFNKYIYWANSGSDFENKLFADIERIDSSKEINPFLNKQEIDKIKSLAKDFKDLGFKKDEQWRVKDEHYNKEVYLWAAEAYGDLTGLRYLLNKAGLTKNFGDDISPAIMEKANTNEQTKNDPIFLRMKVIFGDKNIIKFNNTISANEKGNVKNDIMGFVDNLSSYISKV